MEEIGLTKKKKKFKNFLRKYCTLQDAGQGQESFKCEKLCQPPLDRTTARRERLFSRIIVTRPDQCLEARGTEMFVRLAKCPECGTHLPVGSRLTPFRDLGSLGGGGGGGGGGCTLGSTMLKEGYTLPFQSRPSLTRSPKLSNAMHIFTGTYIG